MTLPATISIAENTSIVTQAVATDSEGSAITYALSGADAATFYLTSTGLVSFRAVPDYESLSKTQYNITVTVTNAGGLTASGAMVVNVTDISENFLIHAVLGSVSLNKLLVGTLLAFTCIS